MLQIKSKYKIAKRLGAGVFEQTQTQKFALSDARAKAAKKSRGGRGGSDYGKQLLEKQRVRFTYGISEKQLSNYASAATHTPNPSASLNRALEMRIDNAVYRAGFAKSRRAARQIVSHGHIIINGKRTTASSYSLHAGDVFAVREGSIKSPLFAGLAENSADNTRSVPKWLEVDISTLRAKVLGEPEYEQLEGGLDYARVFEFYSR